MRQSLSDLKSLLKDNTVFIIGGGDSLKGFDYSKLDDKLVIGINQACVYLPNLTAIYWADENWAAKNDNTLNRHNCKLRFTGKMNLRGDYATSSTKAPGGATLLSITGKLGLDSDINNVRGDNSGSHVINLCINAGAKKIVLLGFDMKVGHWHNDYEFGYDDGIYQTFLASINSIAAALPEDVEIINCSLESNIKVFPKVPFDEL